MKKLLSFILMGMPLLAGAQNPIIRDQFAADPTARVFNNKVYVYPSHDIFPPEGQRQDWFCILPRTLPTGPTTASLSLRTRCPGCVQTPIPCGHPTVSTGMASTISISPQHQRMAGALVSVWQWPTVLWDRSPVSLNLLRALTASILVCFWLPTATPISSGVLADAPS